MLAENFVERGRGRRQAGDCQVRQQSDTEISATDVKGFYLNLVLVRILRRGTPDDCRSKAAPSTESFYTPDTVVSSTVYLISASVFLSLQHTRQK